MFNWRCVTNCGACCNLAIEDRPELESYLSQEELKLYYSLIGEGDWCIYFDHETRKCKIYDRRPSFCRVNTENFVRMFGISPEEFEDFAIECCQQQIEGVYGRKSQELKVYKESIKYSK